MNTLPALVLACSCCFLMLFAVGCDGNKEHAPRQEGPPTRDYDTPRDTGSDPTRPATPVPPQGGRAAPDGAPPAVPGAPPAPVPAPSSPPVPSAPATPQAPPPSTPPPQE